MRVSWLEHARHDFLHRPRVPVVPDVHRTANTDAGSYVPAGHWSGHQRIHQYAGEVTETWGGASVTIDRDYLDVVSGTPVPCDSVNLDFGAYPQVSSGSTGNTVRAAQCLLANAGQLAADIRPSGTFDTATTNATRAFQRSRGLNSDGIVGPRAWTALLSTGDTPTLREGDSGRRYVSCDAR